MTEQTWVATPGWRMIHGDAYTAMSDMPTASVDLIITSPRYNVGMDYDGLNDRTPWPDYYAEIGRFLRLAHSLLRDGGVLALNLPKDVRLTKQDMATTGHRVEKVATRVDLMCEEIGFLPREAIVWVKGSDGGWPMATGAAMGADNNVYIRPTCEMILLHSKGRYYYDGGTGRRGAGAVPFREETKDVWQMLPAPYDGEHPAAFPVQLPERLIRMFTCTGKRTPVVLDPFAGTGTTLLAAVRTGRYAVGIEQSGRYWQIAIDRLRAYDMQPRLPLQENGQQRMVQPVLPGQG